MYHTTKMSIFFLLRINNPRKMTYSLCLPCCMKSTSLSPLPSHTNALWRKVTSVRTCILPSNSPKLLVVYDLPKREKKIQPVVRFIFIYCRLFIGYLARGRGGGWSSQPRPPPSIMSSYIICLYHAQIMSCLKCWWNICSNIWILVGVVVRRVSYVGVNWFF